MYAKYPGGGFAVPAGDLGFSVGVFVGCALVCIAVLAVRRALYGGELGGPKAPARATAALFTLLWCVYIGASSWKTLSHMTHE